MTPPDHAPLSRRSFLAAAAAAVPLAAGQARATPGIAPTKPPLFKISLAEWSLHRTLREGKLDNLDFPKTAKRDFGIEAVEYVNSFFKDKAKDADYLRDLAKRSADEGVTNVLVMCDGLGHLGDPDDKARTKAIENDDRADGNLNPLAVVETAQDGSYTIRVGSLGSGDESMGKFTLKVMAFSE